jgi:TPR repeat protein
MKSATVCIRLGSYVQSLFAWGLIGTLTIASSASAFAFEPRPNVHWKSMQDIPPADPFPLTTPSPGTVSKDAAPPKNLTIMKTPAPETSSKPKHPAGIGFSPYEEQPEVKRPSWLGVSRWMANQQEAVLCGVLKNSPAGRAGLKIDDSIIRINGRPIPNIKVFHEVIDSLKPGTSIPIEIKRNDSTLTVNLVPEARPIDGGTQLIAAAAEAGEAWAMMEMGVRLSQMRGAYSFATEDHVEAANWFHRAAEAGDPAAHFFLGRLYLTGKGVKKDNQTAQRWFVKARQLAELPQTNGVRKGLASAASIELSRMCFNQWITDAKPEHGLVFLKDAAKHGSLHAMAQLGMLYEQGQHVEKDLETAKSWYRLAAERQYKPAIDALERLEGNAGGTNRPADPSNVTIMPRATVQATKSTAASSQARALWRHAQGYFRSIGNGKWIERSLDLAKTDSTTLYSEIGQYETYIELADTSGTVKIRLTDQTALIQRGNHAAFVELHKGEWNTLPSTAIK